MSRRLPICAGCGRSLSRCGRCLHEFTGVRGKPMIGTCWPSPKGADGACMDSVPPLHGPQKVKLAPVLRMIAARGPGRVMLLGKVTLDEACADAERIDGERAKA